MKRRDVLKIGGVSVTAGGLAAVGSKKASEPRASEHVELESPMESLAIVDYMLEVKHQSSPEELYQEFSDERLDYVGGRLYLNGEINSSRGIKNRTESFPVSDSGTYTLKIDAVYEETELEERILFETRDYEESLRILSNSVTQTGDF